jgi:hypothetical protein
MDKETFITRLIEASNSALKLAREFTFNEIAENLIYKIKPSSLDLSDHLTDLEKENLSNRKKELNKKLTVNEVTDRLMFENKVPVWINCSVIGSTKKRTTIELFTSRRFRDDSELYHKMETYPPFHAVIMNPPYLFDNKEKFDVNWRKKKIQTAIKLRKSKIELNKLIKEKRESGKDYWYNFDQFCETLTKRKKVDLAEKLKNAKKLVNGLTDGWYDFKKELDLIYNSNRTELVENELADFEYLRNEIDKVLKTK